MKRFTFTIVMAVLLCCVSFTPAQQPATRPETWRGNFIATLKLNNAATLDESDVRAVFYNDRGLPVTAGVTYDRPSLSAGNRVLMAVVGKGATPEAVNEILLKFTKNSAGKGAAFSPQERKNLLTKIDAELAEIPRKQDALQAIAALNDRPETSAEGQLIERVKKMRADLQSMEMELNARRARRDALEMGLKEEKTRSMEQREGDEVTRELRTLVDLRMKDMEQKRVQVQAGVLSTSEMAAAQVALSEAKIRLAERTASMGKTGKGELLDRLSDELALVSVEMTEMEIRISGLRRELSVYEPTTLDDNAIKALLDRSPQIARRPTTNPNQMYSELQRRLTDLRRERFSLLVDDVTAEVTVNAPQPARQ